MQPRRLHLLAAPLGLWLTACSATAPPPPARPSPPVVLISIDTLRSDHLPAYGYTGVDTPAIDGLARDGILFARAFSEVPLTLPSHVSILSGKIPPEHGVRDNLGFTVDPQRAPLLQQRLKARGYATGAAVSTRVLAAKTGIAAGFDFYDEPPATVGGRAALQSAQRAGGETLAAALGLAGLVAGPRSGRRRRALLSLLPPLRAPLALSAARALPLPLRQPLRRRDRHRRRGGRPPPRRAARAGDLRPGVDRPARRSRRGAGRPR